DLAARADICVFLDFHECADAAVVADLTPVQICEAMNADFAAELYVLCDAQKVNRVRTRMHVNLRCRLPPKLQERRGRPAHERCEWRIPTGARRAGQAGHR